MVNIILNEHINKCFNAEDGKIIFDIIFQHLKNNETINVSFKTFNTVTSSFVNNAFINLLKHFDFLYIKEKINFVDTTKMINEIIKSRFRFELNKIFIYNYNDFKQNFKKTIDIFLNSNVKTSYKNINDFPTESGVYILFDKNIIVYVGSGQNIKKRCSQNLISTDTEATLTKNICCIENIDVEKAINYIKTLSAVFIFSDIKEEYFDPYPI